MYEVDPYQPVTAPPAGPAGAPPEAPPASPPRRPSAWRRVLAWAVDFAIVLTVAGLLAAVTYQRISAMITDVPSLAGTSGWQLLDSRGDLAGAAQEVGESLWRDAVAAVQQAFAALVVFAFLYQFLALALTGRTVGKAVMGLRVVPARPQDAARRLGLGAGRAGARAAVTAVADVGCFAVACCLLVAGSFLLSVLAWAIAVGVFWCNGVPALRGRGRSLADRLAGTALTDTRLLRAATDAARGLASRARVRGRDAVG